MNKPTHSPQADGVNKSSDLNYRLEQRRQFRRQVYQPHSQRGTYRYLNDFFHSLRAPLQTFTVDSSQDNIINGSQGVAITLPKNSCLHLDNQPVTGNIQVELRELKTQADMLFSNLPSTTEDRLLETNGMFYLNIHQGYLPLRLQRGLPVRSPLNADIVNPLALRLYRGYTTTSQRNKFDSLDWQHVGDGHVGLQRETQQNHVQTTIRKLHWNNIAAPYRTSTRHRKLFSLLPKVAATLTEVTAFIVFNQINCVARMYWQRGRLFFYNLPAGQAFKVVAIGKTEQEFYYGQVAVNERQIATSDLVLTPITEEELIVKIYHLG